MTLWPSKNRPTNQRARTPVILWYIYYDMMIWYTRNSSVLSSPNGIDLMQISPKARYVSISIGNQSAARTHEKSVTRKNRYNWDLRCPSVPVSALTLTLFLWLYVALCVAPAFFSGTPPPLLLTRGILHWARSLAYVCHPHVNVTI